MKETQERFFIFIDKLKEKLQEFAVASIPELTEMGNSDTDEYKRSYYRMQAAVLGQLESIIKKAREVKEEKVTNFPYNENSRDAYYQFRTECYAKYQELDDLYDAYRDKIQDTFSEDYEAKYQNILNEYNTIKDKFKCSQCGSPIIINKIYFTTTYITCPACQTKNTFEPSSQAKTLEHLGRSLAEQRTKHLLEEHNKKSEIPHQLYLQAHQIKLSLIHEKDKKIIAQKEQEILELEKQKADIEQEIPFLYINYLRAMFDEWNKINPDLQEEHEKFYNRLLTDYKQTKNI